MTKDQKFSGLLITHQLVIESDAIDYTHRFPFDLDYPSITH